MSDASADWASFLDSLESELHAVQRAATGRRRSRVAFEPPTDLGPLPRELADRARAVLAALERTAEEVRTEMRQTTKQLEELRHLDPRGPKPPSSFDSRA